MKLLPAIKPTFGEFGRCDPNLFGKICLECYKKEGIDEYKIC
jgi:hypothetical protein